MDWTARIRGPKTIRETVPIFLFTATVDANEKKKAAKAVAAE